MSFLILKNFFKIFHFILPSWCPNCSNLCDNFFSLPFCLNCWNKVENIQTINRCSRCGKPLPIDYTICNECIKSPFYFDKVFVYGNYDGVLKDAIKYMKFGGMHKIAIRLGILMLKKIDMPMVECIVPVPLSKKRLLKRGFNQSFFIAKVISKRKKIPLDIDLLFKVRDTLPQSLLSGKQRIENPKGAYLVKRKKNLPMSVMIVDDVMTTGATLNECAKVLKKIGIKKVYAAVVAKTN